MSAQEVHGRKVTTIRRRHRIKVTRDLVLFTVGLAGVIWQTLAEQVDRPYLLAIYSGMMGLPIFLRLDAKNDQKQQGE